MRLIRHARNRVRWIWRGHPIVSEELLLEAIPRAQTVGYDDRGNRRARVSLGRTGLTVVIDEAQDVIVTPLGGVSEVAVYTYDEEADVLYVLLTGEAEAAIDRTEEIGPNLHVDLDAQGKVIGVEFLYPRTHGIEVVQVKKRYGIDLDIPFSFAA